jgi:hypothetical protein
MGFCSGIGYGKVYMVLFVADDVVLVVVRNMILAPFEAVFDSIAHVVSSFLARSGTES